MEIIKSIEEVTDHKIDPREYTTTYDGFKIVTDKQTIYLLIENEQDCCEEFGYFMSEDNLQSFIGAGILAINKVDKDRAVKPFDKDLEEGNVMFVNIETDKGTLQFVAYNSHNGYYGHEALLISEQLNLTENL